MITDPMHGITLGGLELMKYGRPVDHDAGFTTEVSADGITWGNPEAVVSQIISALTDGDIMSRPRYGNRRPVMHVRISGPAGALTAGEKALAGVVGRPVELVWQPPDENDQPTVFDVVHSTMEFTFDDLDELQHERSFVVTLTALPWGHAVEKVITPAVATAAAVSVNDGSSTSGWSVPRADGSPVLSTSGGAVISTYDASSKVGSFYGTDLRLTASVDVSTTKYLAVTWKSSVANYHAVSVNGGPNLTEVLREPAASSYTRSWYRVSDDTVSLSTIRLGTVHPQGTGSATLSIDKVERSDTLPVTGTARQLTRTIDPGGSVAAEGDVMVEHATEGLGQTIAFSHPAGGGYSPSIDQWLTSSNTPTPDASTVSGRRISLSTTPCWFDIPMAALPVGDAHLWVRVRLATGAAATAGIYYGVRSVMGGVELDAEEVQTLISFPAAGTWVLAPIARSVLPPRNLGPAGKVRVFLLRSTVHDIELDAAWLFSMDKGRLTVVDCGTGTPAVGTVHNRLRVVAPSLEVPFGRIEVATAPDWSDAYTPTASKVLCDQTGHRFDPDGSLVTTVTSGTTDAAVSLAHYPRGHSNIGTD